MNPKLIVLLAVLAVAGSTAPAGAAATTIRAVHTLEDKIVREVNAIRSARGLPRVRTSNALKAGAADRTRHMAVRGYFGHRDPAGRPFWRYVERRYASEGYRVWSVGENVQWSAPPLDAQTAVRRWLANPPHRRILLERKWREIGVSAVRATDAHGFYAGADVTIVALEVGVRTR